MWICLNDAFLSIVDKAKKKNHLLVRARRAGDIERTFPGVSATVSDGTDYRYRAEVPRQTVALVIAEQIANIDYDNFKATVADRALHDAYVDVWHTMGRLQPGGPYSKGLRTGRRQRTIAGI